MSVPGLDGALGALTRLTAPTGQQAKPAALQGGSGLSGLGPSGGAGGTGSVGDAFERVLRGLDGELKTADRGAEAVAAGTGDVQESVLGMVRAELDLRVALAVRDRLVEGYRDIERMAL